MVNYGTWHIMVTIGSHSALTMSPLHNFATKFMPMVAGKWQIGQA